MTDEKCFQARVVRVSTVGLEFEKQEIDLRIRINREDDALLFRIIMDCMRDNVPLPIWVKP